MQIKRSVFDDANFDIALSEEWFGDGKAAYKEVIISRKFADLIISKKWKGIKLQPVKLID
jgi:hypothetical protein